MRPARDHECHVAHASGTAASRRRHIPPITPATTDALAGVIEEGYHLHSRAAAILGGGPRGAAGGDSVMACEAGFHVSPIPFPPCGPRGSDRSGAVYLRDRVASSAQVGGHTHARIGIHIQVPMHPDHERVHDGARSSGSAASRRHHIPPITPATTDALAGVIEEG